MPKESLILFNEKRRSTGGEHLKKRLYDLYLQPNEQMGF